MKFSFYKQEEEEVLFPLLLVGFYLNDVEDKSISLSLLQTLLAFNISCKSGKSQQIIHLILATMDNTINLSLNFVDFFQQFVFLKVEFYSQMHKFL